MLVSSFTFLTCRVGASKTDDEENDNGYDNLVFQNQAFQNEEKKSESEGQVVCAETNGLPHSKINGGKASGSKEAANNGKGVVGDGMFNGNYILSCCDLEKRFRKYTSVKVQSQKLIVL